MGRYCRTVSIKIKEVVLFVLLPIILMSLTLSIMGTEDFFAVHHESPIPHVNIYTDSENLCDSPSCQVYRVTN